MSEGQKEKEIVVCIRPSGALDFLYDEALGIQGLGRRRVERASHVEVPAGAEEWEARCARTGRLIHRDASRSRCLDEERAYFNDLLESGTDPFAD